MKNKKAFTLVELIVVLVILAIVAMIVTPIVLGVLKNAEKRARERSIDGYGKAIETAFFDYELSNGTTTTDISKLSIKYTGDEVICDNKMIRENGEVYLSKCSVGGIEVKDSKGEDGYYQYGTSNREYIRKYALAMEQQIEEYIRVNSKRPEDLKTLNNKYSNTVSCNKQYINYNNTLYLSECSVGGTEEKDEKTEDGYYHYGYLQEYKMGDKINFKGTEFYVIADSGFEQNYVTLLKAEPLTVDEIKKYGEGRINGNVESYSNNYGKIPFGNTNNYSYSDIGYIVTAWASDKVKFSSLKYISLVGARLITKQELMDLGCDERDCEYSKYKWIYSVGSALSEYGSSDDIFYWYWTMEDERYSSSNAKKMIVGYSGDLNYYNVNSYKAGIRPVVHIYKKAM